MAEQRALRLPLAAPAKAASVTIYRDEESVPLNFETNPVQDAWIGRIERAFPNKQRIAVIAPTSVEAVLCWRAILLSGRVPVMLHFPTPKLSRDYWRREILTAIETLGIEAVAHFGPLADPGPVIARVDIARADESPVSPAFRFFGMGKAIQLSSGTTGHRKGIGLDLPAIMRHVADYNQSLGLGGDDCIVSWLPLYHDMGFIATFLMPVLLGVRLVLIDPVTWVGNPRKLYELIEQHGGTRCYMPNFGFEVMARHAGDVDLSSMRQWISCSEPTRIDTLRRFMDATNTEPSRMANCYAMAENVFAVTFGDGVRVEPINQTDIVSCGKPIAGVSIKIHDDEVFVRSDYAVKNYEGGKPIVDREGYYPTGDLGTLIDGQLFLFGRKQDIMIQAGRKFLLSDLDHEIAVAVPESAGRICVTVEVNPSLGTEEPVCLVEDQRHWEKNRDPVRGSAIRNAIGLEMAKVAFVPPRFLTKTSSGKINRRQSAHHWRSCEDLRRTNRSPTVGDADRLARELTVRFPGIDFEQPFNLQLDSLGLLNLAIVLSEHGLPLQHQLSLSEMLTHLGKGTVTPEGDVIKVVSLVDLDAFNTIIRSALEIPARHFGVHIHFKHVCAPPAPILLSDLVFEDYFYARDQRPDAYDGLRTSLKWIREADLIIVDDLIQLVWPQQWATGNDTYPRLSHRFENSPLSPYLAVRWARYTDNNHLLATETVDSRLLTPSETVKAINDLEAYLDIPVLRVALSEQHRSETRHWHVHGSIDTARFFENNRSADQFPYGNAMVQHLADLFPRLRRHSGPAVDTWDHYDQPHMCSWLVNPDLVDYVLDLYDSFLVLGKPGSIPYLSSEAARRNKRLTFRSDLLCPADTDFQCVLQTGSAGRPLTDKPIFQLMAAAWGEVANNCSDAVRKACPKPRYHAR